MYTFIHTGSVHIELLCTQVVYTSETINVDTLIYLCTLVLTVYFYNVH